MLLVITVIVAIGSALAAASVASAKDCNGLAWLVAGFLLGPIGVIAAAGLPDRKLRRTMRLIAEAQGIDVDGRASSQQPAAGDISDEALEAKRRGVSR